jgi:curved DNA-binding protein CbpA
VLGVDSGADTGTVRKAYWRLSLLVHPDKCSHASAHEAFQAVSKAAKLLQDAEARKAHDAAAEDAALRKAAIAAAAAAERQAAWATARGEAVPAEVAAQLAAARAAAAGPVTRETWMTDLPPEKRQRSTADALAGLSQVRHFGRLVGQLWLLGRAVTELLLLGLASACQGLRHVVLPFCRG